jgi:hypothetical protein
VDASQHCLRHGARHLADRTQPRHPRWTDLTGTRNKRRQINDICEAAAQVAQASKAADIGTALHAMVEQVNLGHTVDAGIYAADLDAYRWAISQMGWQIHPDHVECRMVCDSLQMAGTCDMLVQNDDGEYFVADLKTSASVDYGGLGWAAQLAAYAHSDIYSPLLQCRLETPAINQQVGYIVHLPAGQGVCTIHQVDLVKGYEAAALANEIRDTRKASKQFITPVYTAEADTPATDTPDAPPEAPQGHTEALADRVRWLSRQRSRRETTGHVARRCPRTQNRRPHDSADRNHNGTRYTHRESGGGTVPIGTANHQQP